MSANGNSVPSADAEATPQVSAPAKPAKPTAEAGNKQVTLFWTDPGNANIQKYQYEKNGDGAWENISGSGATTTTYTVKELTNGTAYTFKIRAVTAGGEGPASDASDPVTPNLAPGQPQNFRLEPGNTTITLRWDDQSTDAAGIAKWQYKEKVGDADWPARWNDITAPPGVDAKDMTSIQRHSLRNGTRYGYRLRAVATGDVFGPVSDDEFATPAGPPAAAALSAVGEPRQVTLSWTVSSADESVEKWQYQQVAGTTTDPNDFASVPWSPIEESDASTRSHTVLKLASGSAYSFRVRAVGYGGNGTESNIVTATPTPGPAAAILSAEAGAGRVSLSWTLDADASINKWEFRQREGDAAFGDDWTDVPGSDASTRSHTVTELTRGVSHGFQVRAVSDDGDGTESNVATATPPPGPAAAILSAEAAARQVTLSWTLDADASINKWEFRQREGDAAFGDDWTNVPGSYASTRSHTVTVLTGGVSHGFQVRAVADDGNGAESNVATATPPPGPVAAVLSAEAGPRRVTLSWTLDADSSINKWEFRQREGDAAFSDDWTDVPGSDASTRSHTVLELTGGVSHGFQVRAVADDGDGAASNVATATPPPGPAAAVLSAEAGPRRVSLSWTLDADSSINKWEFRQREGDAAFGDDWTDVPGSYASTRSHTVLELTGGVSYGFQVRAVSDAGDGTESNVVTVTPPPGPAAAVLSAEAGARRVSLSWTLDADASINKWEFRQREGDAAFGDDWTDVPGSDASTRSHTVLELTGGVSYGFQVRAVSEAGDGTESNVATATPPPGPAAAVLSAEAGARRVSLSWTLDADASINKWEFRQREGDAAFGDDWTDVPGSDASTRSHTVLELTGGVSYGFQVRAVSEAGDGTESNVATATPPPGPAAAVLSAEAGARRVSLSWTLDADASINKWEFRQREGDAAFGDDWTDVPGSDASTRSHTVLELTGGVSYGFQVRAVSDAGDGTESNVVTVTPTSGPAAEEERRLLKPTLAAVARATLSGAVETLSQRFDAAPGTRGALTLAGRQLGGATLSPETGAGAFGAHTTPALGTAPRVASDETGRRGGQKSYGVDGDALLRGSAFVLPLAGAEAGAGGRDWTVWGRGDWRSFEGRMNGDSWDGKQRTGWLGVDARVNPRLAAGLAVSRGYSEADYWLEEFEGRLDTSVTALWPYFQMTTGNGGTVQLFLGVGTGEVEHRKFDGTEEKEDLSLLAGSVSGRMPMARMGAASLSALASASLAEIETDGSSSTSSIGGLTAGVWSLRGGLEAEHDGVELASGSGWLFRPHGALALRQDGGDGVTGTGVEVSGGVRLTSPGSRFGLEASGLWLALHSEDGKREMGASLEARLAPAADGRGLSLSVGPAWGKQGIGALTRERLFDAEGGGEAPERLSLTGSTAYGFEAAGGLLTPFADMSIVEDSSAQHYRAGVGFAKDGIDADLTVGHRAGGEPDTRIGLDLRLNF